jgi:5-carboxymethyl-2-hydroxymuconate isomerase
MTKKEMFVAIREVVADNAEMVAFIDHELELLAKRSSSERKPTKAQIENEGFKADIVAYLATVDAPKCIKDIQTELASVSGLTNQRITHLLTDLVKAETLVKSYVKKTPYYSVA